MPTVDNTSSSSATQFSMIGLVVGFGTLGGIIGLGLLHDGFGSGPCGRPIRRSRSA
jgi:hypothetical protein